MLWVNVQPEGQIYSWTLSHHNFVKGVALSEPVVIALVEIAEAPGVRIPCRQEKPGSLPKIGEPVRLEVAVYEGRHVWSFAQHASPFDDGSDHGEAS